MGDVDGPHVLHVGEYVVDGALVPVAFDAEDDQGIYVEPNVWMLHRL